MTVDQNPPNPTTLLNKKIKKTNNNIHKSSTHVTSSSVSSSSSSSSSYCSKAKGVRLFTNRRNPRVFKRTRSQADALALPLGMSIAAFVAKVLEKKDATEEKMSVEHLSEGIRCNLCWAGGLQEVMVANQWKQRFGHETSTIVESCAYHCTTP